MTRLLIRYSAMDLLAELCGRRVFGPRPSHRHTDIHSHTRDRLVILRETVIYVTHVYHHASEFALATETEGRPTRYGCFTMTCLSAELLYVDHVYDRDTKGCFMSCRLRRPTGRKARHSSVAVPLSERLYQWRKRKDFSQSEAALRLQLSTRTLQEWEQGRARPRHLALDAVDALIKP
jgi:DNA-binding XRE family transcriptional regulator